MANQGVVTFMIAGRTKIAASNHRKVVETRNLHVMQITTFH